MKEPTRLLEDAGTSKFLREALGALEQDLPSASVVSRVENALSALPPPPLPAATFSLSAVIGTSSLMVIAVTTALIVHTREPASPKLTAAPVAHVAEAAREGAPSTAPVTPEVPVVAAPALPSRRRVSSPKQPAQVKPSSAPPLRMRAPTEPQATRAEPTTSGEIVADGPSAKPADAVSGPAALQQPEPTEARAIKPSPEPPAPEDEAGLLYRAKRLSTNAPAAALALLELHARHFAHSPLEQERDVLVINLHQRLGHVERARQLAAEFRARFPNSVYRTAVEP